MKGEVKRETENILVAVQDQSFWILILSSKKSIDKWIRISADCGMELENVIYNIFTCGMFVQKGDNRRHD